MPPKFNASSFDFEENETIPDHIEEWPQEESRDRSKIWLEGYDTFAHESYTLAIDIDDRPTAEVLHAARRRQLERTQPSASSGGQMGIQDRVSIIMPEA